MPSSQVEVTIGCIVYNSLKYDQLGIEVPLALHGLYLPFTTQEGSFQILYSRKMWQGIKFGSLVVGIENTSQYYFRSKHVMM